ncbi:replication initiation negative regulator SeqA [Thalassomonas actiniarum]|uniref:Negative modulator of initiation of replication n=1 Tax=Thalassomonas actiniarum TaxID=485447 RepID=A0AAE9YV65_9GAMM|nr:replication initiation negative regulator SeqA [Thalassomonas actiniarum]WDE00949.1 replication initiation negative regulator SeqA [Thalassomonas actiniarum]
MKNIEIDEELYQYIATNTQFIGESASSILRRLLSLESSEKTAAAGNEASVANNQQQNTPQPNTENAKNKVEAKAETKTKKADLDVSGVDSEKAVEEKPQVQAINGNETVFNYINKEELGMQRGAVGRFLLILAALYRVHPQQFALVRDIRGRDRLYFSDNESDLNASGSSTKPRQIPDSPYWVITNSNTTRKKMMLTEVAVSLGYGESDAEKIRELL